MITIIVATDDNLLIGKEDSSNGMPWSLPEDLKHFKETTINKTIVMGLTTYQAIGRPLPNRKTIVVSFDEFVDERVSVCRDLIGLLEEYKNSEEELFISGGASIYKQALPYSNKLLISRVPGTHTGETYFPSFEAFDYQLSKETPFETFMLQEYTREV